MAEDRMIRASMRESEKVNSWPIPLRYFWTQLWGYCDSYGRGRRDTRLILAGTFPLDPDVTPETIERWMVELESEGVVECYEFGGKRYFECPGWDEHQQLNYKKKSNIPDRFGALPNPQKSSGKVQKVSAEVEGEKEGEREEEGLPSPFCPEHPRGTGTPCRACGRARIAYAAATEAQKNKPTPGPPRKEDLCPNHDWLLKTQCKECFP